MSSKNKDRLGITNAVVQNTLESVCKYFRNDFIDNIVQANRSKFFECSRGVNFRSKAYQGLIDRFKKTTRMKEILHCINNISFNNLPKFLKEKRGHTIWPWRLVWMHQKDYMTNFLICDFLVNFLLILARIVRGTRCKIFAKSSNFSEVKICLK